jgi:hypothetical protein
MGKSGKTKALRMYNSNVSQCNNIISGNILNFQHSYIHDSTSVLSYTAFIDIIHKALQTFLAKKHFHHHQMMTKEIGKRSLSTKSTLVVTMTVRTTNRNNNKVQYQLIKAMKLLQRKDKKPKN